MCRILNEYFADSDEWHPLGASMDKPIEGGFGEYVQNNFDKLSSRHASAIAAILVNEGLVLAKGKKPIYLKRNPQKKIDLKV
jgi:hypothetical protein